jgi:rod shape-determining protein MreC
MALRARARSTRSLVILLVTASLITITVDYRQGRSGPLGVAGRAALTVITPLQKVMTRVIDPIGDFFSTITRIPSLQDENTRLKSELAALRLQAVQDIAQERELALLRELFAMREAYNLPSVGAYVIGSGVSNFEWTITIDKGSEDGIRADMPVLAGGGLVGRVIKVISGASEVALIVDPGSRVAARIISEGNVTGILEGRGDQDLKLRLIPPDVPLQAGAQVVTAGYDGGVYPPNIPIGVISRVVPDPAALEQLVLVRPHVDLSALEVVQVVLTPGTG